MQSGQGDWWRLFSAISRVTRVDFTPASILGQVSVEW